MVAMYLFCLPEHASPSTVQAFKNALQANGVHGAMVVVGDLAIYKLQSTDIETGIVSPVKVDKIPALKMGDLKSWVDAESGSGPQSAYVTHDEVILPMPPTANAAMAKQLEMMKKVMSDAKMTISLPPIPKSMASKWGALDLGPIHPQAKHGIDYAAMESEWLSAVSKPLPSWATPQGSKKWQKSFQHVPTACGVVVRVVMGTPMPWLTKLHTLSPCPLCCAPEWIQNGADLKCGACGFVTYAIKHSTIAREAFAQTVLDVEQTCLLEFPGMEFVSDDEKAATPSITFHGFGAVVYFDHADPPPDAILTRQAWWSAIEARIVDLLRIKLPVEMHDVVAVKIGGFGHQMLDATKKLKHDWSTQGYSVVPATPNKADVVATGIGDADMKALKYAFEHNPLDAKSKKHPIYVNGKLVGYSLGMKVSKPDPDNGGFVEIPHKVRK